MTERKQLGKGRVDKVAVGEVGVVGQSSAYLISEAITITIFSNIIYSQYIVLCA